MMHLNALRKWIYIVFNAFKVWAISEHLGDDVFKCIFMREHFEGFFIQISRNSLIAKGHYVWIIPICGELPLTVYFIKFHRDLDVWIHCGISIGNK